jgi:broad specificity phosphatase PhoE
VPESKHWPPSELLLNAVLLDLSRAKSAEFIAEPLVKTHHHAELKERNFGIWEGMSLMK